MSQTSTGLSEHEKRRVSDKDAPGVLTPPDRPPPQAPILDPLDRVIRGAENIVTALGMDTKKADGHSKNMFHLTNSLVAAGVVDKFNGMFITTLRRLQEFASGKGSTFVAKFADGRTTRTTIYHASPSRLDLGQSVEVSKTAYQAGSSCKPPPKPPPIVEARFETVDGVVLRTYSAEELT
jgi:hypothetical protein